MINKYNKSKKINKLSKALFSVLVVICIFIACGFYSSVSSAANASGDQLLIVDVVALEAGGDCIIIRINDTEIIIDCGQSDRNNSSYSTIEKNIKSVMKIDDGKKWDYVIFTHADNDHIGNAEKLFDLLNSGGWSIGTIIDFDDGKSTGYEKYRQTRESACEISNAAYFSATSLNDKEKIKSYDIGSDCKLNILFNPLDKDGEKKNNTSVCCLITYKNQKLLFTGDLESKGERKLIETHGDLLEDVTFFKANHHGSNNANSESFIDIIRPGYVAITKSTNQNHTYIVDSVNSFLKYTDYIYPTHVTYYNETRELYGESVFYFDGKDVRVETEKNTSVNNIFEAVFNYNGRSINWFDTVIADSDSSNGQQLYESMYVYTFDEDRAAYNGCTLIKHGHTDIVIDCGSNKPGYEYVDKLKDYVTDGVIEYLIVTNHSNVCISQLVDSKGERGVFNNFKIGKIIEGSKTIVDSYDEHPTYDLFVSEVENKSNHIVLNPDENYKEDFFSGCSLFVAGSNNNSDIDENALSLYAIIDFNIQKLVFVGNQVAYGNIKNANGTNVKDVAFMRLPSTPLSMEDMKDYEIFLKNAAPKFSTIGSPVDYTLSNGQVLNSVDTCRKTLKVLKGFGMSNIYPVGYMSGFGGYINENKDIVFSIKYNGKDCLIGMEKEYKCLESMIGK